MKGSSILTFTASSIKLSMLLFLTIGFSGKSLLSVLLQQKVQENKQDKSTDETYRIFNSLKLSDEQVAKWCNYYKVDFPQELTETQLQFIIDRFRKLGDK